MGPTAAGKTGIAVELVSRLPLEIISVDSAMVYRGMDIGTAKPDAETLAVAPHRLIDIRDPWESYSVADFLTDARQAIRAIQAAGRVPQLTGGTMMNINALVRGLAPLPDADPEIRRRLEARAGEVGWPALHQQLAQVDPAAAARIQPTDPQRIERALEVFEITGQPISELQKQPGEPLPGRLLSLAVAPPHRAVLHQRIEQRFVQMLEQGFIEEVSRLRQDPRLNRETPSMRSVGYRQVWQYLDGDFGRDELLLRGVAATRQLAKRQLTWLRREPDAEWVDPLQSQTVDALVRKMSLFIG